MGYEETNVIINDRIHELASKFSNDSIKESEKNELATLIYPKLRYFIWKFCNNTEDTEEALQWTLKKIFKNINNFNCEKGRFSTWIYTIAKNETLFYLHKKGLRKEYFCDCEYDKNERYEDNTDVELSLNSMYDETVSEIYKIEDSLLKNIAIDKMINNEKIKSISIRYDINENTVKTKLRKIRTDIRTRVLEKNPIFKENLNTIFDI